MEKSNPEDDFILLKDYPKFKNEAQIAEIEKVIEQNKEYEIKEGIANKKVGQETQKLLKAEADALKDIQKCFRR